MNHWYQVPDRWFMINTLMECITGNQCWSSTEVRSPWRKICNGFLRKLSTKIRIPGRESLSTSINSILSQKQCCWSRSTIARYTGIRAFLLTLYLLCMQQRKPGYVVVTMHLIARILPWKSLSKGVRDQQSWFIQTIYHPNWKHVPVTSIFFRSCA